VEQSAAGAEADGMHGFPAALTSFVGRAEAVSEVVGLLGKFRLVTVTGPGGAGKTRLAGKVAGRVAGRFADGVWLAELASVRDPALVPAAVAAALGVRDEPGVGVPAAEAIARVLARQQQQLVLDNCEHVIAAAARLCAALLPACDDVRVLATSREPLRLAGEAGYRLAPLTLPGPALPYTRRRQEPRRQARQALGPVGTRAAEERGAAMSLATAAEYALMLTAPGSRQPQAPPGTGKLSARERELVTLVAQGRTDAQIAAQLYISIRTVRSHLDRVRDKTGCRRRADLTRLALSAGLV